MGTIGIIPVNRWDVVYKFIRVVQLVRIENGDVVYIPSQICP